MLQYASLHILASTSLLFYMAFGYQSLSSLDSKRFLWDSCPANSLLIPGRCSLTVYEHSSNFRVMAWREIMHNNIFLPKEHNTLTCHFNIMNNITLKFCTLRVTIHTSLERQVTVANGSPDLLICWQLNSSMNTLSMIFHILFAPNTTLASSIMTVKYRHM